MDNTRQQKLAELAPLTASVAMHLAIGLMKAQPKQGGRPRKELTDVTVRTELRLLNAMDLLINLVKDKRQRVFELVSAAIAEEKLNTKWLMQTLNEYMPDDTVIYPQRVREWRSHSLLLSTAEDQFDPHSVSSILLARLIDQRRSGWLPHPPAVESYWCWRLDRPDFNVYPYELPITQTDPQRPTVISRIIPTPEEPYILQTSWQGATWDGPEWLLAEGKAFRWVGLPSDDQIATWLTPQEQASLAPSASQADRAMRALLIMSDRLHGFSSGDPS